MPESSEPKRVSEPVSAEPDLDRRAVLKRGLLAAIAAATSGGAKAALPPVTKRDIDIAELNREARESESQARKEMIAADSFLGKIKVKKHIDKRFSGEHNLNVKIFQLLRNFVSHKLQQSGEGYLQILTNDNFAEGAQDFMQSSSPEIARISSSNIIFEAQLKSILQYIHQEAVKHSDHPASKR
jgi:hypothetical protein